MYNKPKFMDKKPVSKKMQKMAKEMMKEEKTEARVAIHLKAKYPKKSK